MIADMVNYAQILKHFAWGKINQLMQAWSIGEKKMHYSSNIAVFIKMKLWLSYFEYFF